MLLAGGFDPRASDWVGIAVAEDENQKLNLVLVSSAICTGGSPGAATIRSFLLAAEREAAHRRTYVDTSKGRRT